MTIGNRLRAVRKALGLTQQEFAAAVGLKQSTIAMYEMGHGKASERVITTLCKEYDINRNWLLTGEGEMFRQKTQNETLMELCLDAAENPDSPKGAILAALAALSDEQWQALGDIIKTASAAVQAQKKPDQD